MIEPKLVVLRGEGGIQVALVPEGTSNRVLIKGRVEAAGGLRSLTINGREEKVQGGNLFETQILVKDLNEQVRIVAIDRAGRTAHTQTLQRIIFTCLIT